MGAGWRILFPKSEFVEVFVPCRDTFQEKLSLGFPWNIISGSVDLLCRSGYQTSFEPCILLLLGRHHAVWIRYSVPVGIGPLLQVLLDFFQVDASTTNY